MLRKRLLSIFFVSISSFPLFASSAFNGFYIGGGAGGAFLTAQENVSSQIIVDFPSDTAGNRIRTTVPTNLEASLRDNSAIGALYAGYGLDIHYLYLGAEAFANFASYKLHNSGRFSTEQMLAINIQAYSVANNWQVNTKLSQSQYGLDFRPGVLIKPEMMLFGRVGFARVGITATSNLAGNVDYIASRSESNNLIALTSSNSINKTALRLGGGFEYHFSPKYSVRMDYIHVEYGKISTIGVIDRGITSSTGLLGYRLNNGTLLVTNTSAIQSISSNAVTVGLSYYFS